MFLRHRRSERDREGVSRSGSGTNRERGQFAATLRPPLGGTPYQGGAITTPALTVVEGGNVRLIDGYDKALNVARVTLSCAGNCTTPLAIWLPFAERLLAKERVAERLGPPQG